MSSYKDNVINTIKGVIKPNSKQSITGAKLQDVLVNMADKVVYEDEYVKIWDKGDGENSAVLVGGGCSANGDNSVAEGQGTVANGYASHAEGEGTTAIGEASHAEGYGEIQNSNTLSDTDERFVITGKTTQSITDNPFVDDGKYPMYEITSTTKFVLRVGQVLSSNSDGSNYRIIIDVVVDEYQKYFVLNEAFSPDVTSGPIYILTGTTLGDRSHLEGNGCFVIGNDAHAEGCGTSAAGDYSHAEGLESVSIGSYSHAEGFRTVTEKEGQL